MKFIIIVLIIVMLNATDLKGTECTCVQLKYQSDCLLNALCEWNTSTSTCQTLTNKPPPQPQIVSYCSSFFESSCSEQKPCAWLNNTCTHFTGCSAYLAPTDDQCQSISKRCFKSDGQRCVEIGDCSSYTLQSLCTHSKDNGTNIGYCYWDTTGSEPVCVVAKQCSQLPLSLKSDQECRQEISICRFKQEGGCEISPSDCSDHQNENQCFFNKDQTIKCFWDSNKCLAKNCDNAPLQYLTNEACKQFLPECTTKQGGGCTLRTKCSRATNQAACQEDQDGNRCYWNGIECFNIMCNTAPLSMISNSECEQFKSGCITKEGGGCIQNRECTVANIEIACSKDINGFDCIWDGNCKEKTCDNAPSTFTTHEQCQQYLITCTVKADDQGCQDKKCGNAPLSLTTPEQCEQYLPKNKCIANFNGGCITNTTCEMIGLELSCLRDDQDRDCFWKDGKCKLKSCQNAPASENTHELCQKYRVTCTVNETASGCIEMTCPNLLSENICQNDLNGLPCRWMGGCYMKQCQYAPESLNSHELCLSYLNTCTVTPSLIGCQEIPQNCESLTIEANCKVNKAKQPCGWTGTACMIKNCLTAPKTYNMNYECDSYISGCVVNNEAKGCMSLPTTCNSRGQQQNCQVGSTPKCLWSQTNKQCIDRTCATAPSGSNCTIYVATTACIKNATNTGCAEKPATCMGLAQSQCLPSAKIGGDCYWQPTSNSCVDLICTNLKPTTIDYINCNFLLNRCTVNTTNNGCVERSEKCSDYNVDYQCKFTSSNIRCQWTVSGCVVSTCDDAPTTSLYNDHTKCTGWSNQCTVGLDISDGCVNRSSTCTGLKESKCTFTNTLSRCMWNGAQCVFLSSITQCESLKMSSTYTDNSCSNLMNKCKANAAGDGCIEKTCSQYSGSFTLENCQNWLSTCSLNKAQNGCIDLKSVCSGYQEAECFKANEGVCIWASGCVLVNNSIPCTSIKLSTYSAANCTQVLNKCTINSSNNGCEDKVCSKYIGTLSKQNCKAWLSTCTVNRLYTTCIIRENDCAGYSADNCYEDSKGPCIWDGTQCITLSFTTCTSITAVNQVKTEFCTGLKEVCSMDSTPLTCVDDTSLQNICESYLGPIFNEYNCQQWWQCTLNATGTGCIAQTCENYPIGSIKFLQMDRCSRRGLTGCLLDYTRSGCASIKINCSDYLIESHCQKDQSDKKCEWNSSKCQDLTVPIDCDKIVIPSNFDHYNYCEDRNNSYKCVTNRMEDGCFFRNAIPQYCSGITENECVSSCYWNGSDCVKITDSSEVTRPSGKPLTVDYCMFSGDFLLADDGLSCISKDECSPFQYEFPTNESCLQFRNNCILHSSGTKCILATKCQEYFLTDYSKCNTTFPECTTNLNGDGCVPYKDTCDLYTDSSDCIISKANLCTWSMTCSSITLQSQCNLIANSVFTQEFCNSLIQIEATGCNVNRTATNCIPKPSAGVTCEQLTLELQCTFTKTGQACNWVGGACVTASSCNNYIPPSFTKINCQQYDLTTKLCHVNSTNTACQLSTCADYKGPIYSSFCRSWSKTCTANRQYTSCVVAPTTCGDGTAENCVRNAANVVCKWDGSACTDKGAGSLANILDQKQCKEIEQWKTIYPKCKDIECTDYKGTITIENCFNFSSTCVSQRDHLACLTIKDTCNAYTQVEQCLKSKEGMCNWTGTCERITFFTSCSELKPPTYTDSTCSLLISGCQANSGTTACEDKSCSRRPSGTNLTFQNCQDWLPTCSMNAARTECINLKATCNLYTSAEECNYATEGECMYTGSSCAIKTCTSQTSLTTDDQCTTFLSKCTIGNQGQCVQRQACNLYSSQTQCFKNDQDKDCYWMTHVTTQRCDDLICTNLPLTSPYNSHSGCETALKTCTVAANGSGCASKGECTIYTVQAQCNTSISDQVCAWNNDISPKCQIKSCITASHSLITHSDCYDYIATGLRCTLNSTAKGCQSLAACSTYTQVQCIMDLDGNNCTWKGDKCEIKTCLSASADEYHNDHSKCNNYMNSCTVASSGLGCVSIPNQCSQMTIEDQCRTTSSSELCYWNAEITPPLCQVRKCSNAPSTANNATKCNTHLIGCTLDDIKCKSKNCEDISFTTDEQCKAALPKCTSNGTVCQLRGQCSQATNQAGCVTDVSGKECGWIAQSSRCALKSCETAPLAYTSEQECKSYISSCTANLGGGCTTKGTCSEAKVQAACTKGIDGMQCAWGQDGVCKNQDCSDLISPTHQGCFIQQSTCTTNGNGKCAKMTACGKTTVQQACIVGTDGPCLWVDGACYLYDNCKSIQWNIDGQCKKISNNCTTNGSNCFPITECSKTNTQGGCKSGTDGQCAQSQLEQPVCMKFHSCSELNYKTHEECNSINFSCTSDLEKGCITLMKCEQYTQQGNCYLSGQGIVKNDLNQITQTQFCIWDETLTPVGCRNQKCSDLIGETDKECSDQLSQCTSNGVTCFLQSSCHEYKEQSECEIGTGSDGVCIWNTETLSCKTKECIDFKNGNCSSFKDCIPNYDVDENTCTLKTKCSAYKTIQGCHEGGNDGICVWDQTDNRCVLMTSCPKANNDQIACQAKSSVCLWIDSSNTTDGTYQKNSCKPLSCSLLTVQNCKSFSDWDNTFMTFCIVQDSSCKEVTTESLKSENCYISSGNQYTWNQSTGKCEACNQSVNPINNENPSSSNGFLPSLSMIAIALALL